MDVYGIISYRRFRCESMMSVVVELLQNDRAVTAVAPFSLPAYDSSPWPNLETVPLMIVPIMRTPRTGWMIGCHSCSHLRRHGRHLKGGKKSSVYWDLVHCGRRVCRHFCLLRSVVQEPEVSSGMSALTDLAALRF